MTNTAIILGARGRFGRAAVRAFIDQGWKMYGLAREWPAGSAPAGMIRVTGDAFDAQAVTEAAQGCSVIVNALNSPYPNWKHDLPRLTTNVLAAAKATGATVMMPGNIYNYGAGMPTVLTETTPHQPTTRKGRLRCNMERDFAAAAAQGVQTIVLRAGDFIEGHRTGNWFDTYIAENIARGQVTYPGPMDVVHAWAYLPDMAQAMAGLAAIRTELGGFQDFGFDGYTLTGAELVSAIELAAGRKLKVKGIPWPMLKIAGLVSPMMREVSEMSYLWRMPHTIDGTKLRAALPEFRPTPVGTALAQTLQALGNSGPMPDPASAGAATAIVQDTG